jgi:hypothetical protein
MRFKWSLPMKLSTYILQMSSIPDGRAANHPLFALTFRPPMGALLPGAWVWMFWIFSPASSVSLTC